MRLKQEGVGGSSATDAHRGLAFATRQHEVSRRHDVVDRRLVANRAPARNDQALPHQAGSLQPLGRRNQIERATLIVGPPAAPVAQRLKPGEDLLFRRDRLHTPTISGSRRLFALRFLYGVGGCAPCSYPDSFWWSKGPPEEPGSGRCGQPVQATPEQADGTCAPTVGRNLARADRGFTE